MIYHIPSTGLSDERPVTYFVGVLEGCGNLFDVAQDYWRREGNPFGGLFVYGTIGGIVHDQKGRFAIETKIEDALGKIIPDPFTFAEAKIVRDGSHAGNSWVSMPHEHLLMSMYKIAFTISRRECSQVVVLYEQGC